MKKDVFILFLFLLSTISLAAPAPWGIAINPQTEECTAYWPGDEFSHNSLPEGWVSYRQESNGDHQVIISEYGECVFEVGNEEECCKKLGLPYIDDIYNNPKKTEFNEFILIIPIIIILTLIVTSFKLFLNKKLKKNSK